MKRFIYNCFKKIPTWNIDIEFLWFAYLFLDEKKQIIVAIELIICQIEFKVSYYKL